MARTPLTLDTTYQDLALITLPTTSTVKPSKTTAIKEMSTFSNPTPAPTPLPCTNCSGLSSHSDADVLQVEPIASTKSDQYFPFYVTLGGNQTQTLPNNGTNPLTESERRKRAIYIASGILLVFIIILWVTSRKK